MKWMKVDEIDEWNCKSEIAETQHPTDRCYQYHIHVGFGRVKEENQLDKLQARQTSYISRVCCPLADNFDEMKQINKSQLSTNTDANANTNTNTCSCSLYLFLNIATPA